MCHADNPGAHMAGHGGWSVHPDVPGERGAEYEARIISERIKGCASRPKRLAADTPPDLSNPTRFAACTSTTF